MLVRIFISNLLSGRHEDQFFVLLTEGTEEKVKPKNMKTTLRPRLK